MFIIFLPVHHFKFFVKKKKKWRRQRASTMEEKPTLPRCFVFYWCKNVRQWWRFWMIWDTKTIITLSSIQTRLCESGTVRLIENHSSDIPPYLYLLWKETACCWRAWTPLLVGRCRLAAKWPFRAGLWASFLTVGCSSSAVLETNGRLPLNKLLCECDSQESVLVTVERNFTELVVKLRKQNIFSPKNETLIQDGL